MSDSWSTVFLLAESQSCINVDYPASMICSISQGMLDVAAKKLSPLLQEKEQQGVQSRLECCDCFPTVEAMDLALVFSTITQLAINLELRSRDNPRSEPRQLTSRNQSVGCPGGSFYTKAI
jgi:hypothetical protein